MRILWHNVFALLLAIFATVVLLRNRSAIAAFIETIGDVGPGHSADERTIGLAATGIVVISLLGLIKILTNTNRRDP